MKTKDDQYEQAVSSRDSTVFSQAHSEQTQNELRESEKRLGFEMLLANLSAHLINLPADQVDNVIENAQRHVCEYLHLDCSVLWQMPLDRPNVLLITHKYVPPDFPPVPEFMDAQENFPWSLEKMLKGESIKLSRLSDAPAVAAARDLEGWRHYGIKSVLTFPLSAGGNQTLGALNFNTIQDEMDWPVGLVRRLELVAQIFANALARKQAEIALRESEARLSLATEAVGAGMWIMDVDTKKVWVSPQSRKLFHFAPDEEIFYESYFRKIHPEDRDRIHQEVQQTLRFQENLLCDYRIVLPDGSIRWISARGHCIPKSTGEPNRIMGMSLDITERKLLDDQLSYSLQEVQTLRDRLQMENLYLREEVKLMFSHTEIVGASKPLKEALSKAEQVSSTDSTVLILGETGSGKELLARAIHEMSNRKNRTLVIVNCASLPATLIEGELFGREKGAYTGSLTKMIGRFELADGSTLFLDEIGDLPLELQSKLLRVLEQGEFERLGSTKTIKVNVRVIAATNHDLVKEADEGRFRKDLFYRLNVFPILCPPLRDRKEDIPLLVWSFVKQFEKSLGKQIDSIPKSKMESLINFHWPGNIRELRNIIERAMITNRSNILSIDPPVGAPREQSGSYSLEDLERRHILEVLEKTGWRISGKNSASVLLGMKRTTLQSKIKMLGIKRNV